MAVLHRRVFMPIILCLSLTLVLIITYRNSRNISFEQLKNTYASHEAPESIPSPAAEEAEPKLMTPLFDPTYEQIVAMSSTKPMAKDPCVDLLVSDNGNEAVMVEGTKVLVTGGAGFIGSNLVDRLLVLGYKVRIFDNLYTGFLRNVPLDNPNVELMVGDILDPEMLEKAVNGVEYVFHLAAMSKVVPSTKDSSMARFCTESNALGSWNVLDAVRKKGTIKKVIYAASSTYYGNQPAPHREDMAPDFLTPYAASKYEGELQMQMFDRLFGVPTVSTRFFMVYGPRQPSTGAYAIVTGVFAKQAAEGKPLTIEGDGSHYRDFIHVSDIVEGLILSQQNEELHGDVVNLGSGSAFSVQDVADLVSADQTHVDPRPNDLEGTLADTCKMRRLLNYKTRKDFKTEMGFMAKETMAGNVFAQSWLSLEHALSAPHLLQSGSPLFSWPENSGDWEALLHALKRIEEYNGVEVSAIGHRISVIFFSMLEPDNLERYSDILLNTVYSLVRFGGVKSYMVAASDDAALETCSLLNLPCYDARVTTVGTILSRLVSAGYDIHVSQIGNSYTSSIESALSIARSSKADVVGAKDFGDVLIMSNDRTKSAFSKWATDSNSIGQDVYTLSKWPSMEIIKGSIDIERQCDSSKPIACGKNFYIGVGCAEQADANSTITSLKSSGAWHLSECHDLEHCDRQQTVPLRWISSPPDLETSGGLC
jgi:nucleoside-diphosphate-sugar epimerase